MIPFQGLKTAKMLFMEFIIGRYSYSYSSTRTRNRTHVIITIHWLQVIVLLLGAHFRLAPSQWETSLQSNVVSHWLSANLESSDTLTSHVTRLSAAIVLTHIILASEENCGDASHSSNNWNPRSATFYTTQGVPARNPAHPAKKPVSAQLLWLRKSPVNHLFTQQLISARVLQNALPCDD